MGIYKSNVTLINLHKSNDNSNDMDKYNNSKNMHKCNINSNGRA